MCCYRNRLIFKTLVFHKIHLSCGGMFSESNYKFSPDSDSKIILKIALIFRKVKAYKIVPFLDHPVCYRTVPRIK